MRYNKEKKSYHTPQKNPKKQKPKQTKQTSLYGIVQRLTELYPKKANQKNTSLSPSSEWKNSFNAREGTAGSSCDTAGQLIFSPVSLQRT